MPVVRVVKVFVIKSNESFRYNVCHGKVRGKGLAWDVCLFYPSLTGTGPLACLSLFG